MTTHIKIKKLTGSYVLRAGGAVLGEADEVLELSEGGHPPIIYFNRADIAMDFFDKSTKESQCPHKGQATYYSIIAKSGPIKDAAWSYENPIKEVAEIKDYLAFHSDKATVEEL